MIVGDTSVWIELFRGGAGPSVRVLRQGVAVSDILVGDLILLEILQGAFDDTHAQALERRMRTFEIATMSDVNLAVEAAGHYRCLWARGVTIRKSIDLLFGTFCIRHGHALLHADRDFEPMATHPGLTLVPT
ncbi:type II toxin-antitoxin system VapC family toxin [Prosthecodimorpha staleyi]|uniref:PIN domain nuclease n=1 Tax=Prosthecodimorpha staleyi TaxID=2840188 RepID=A0A947D897_9HYPH|nr:PIN domain nuclease [Prosthecodimorpha staleyi]MBT9290037.1 PIN domain nuclease [Prosthecodimorpha staleyi]